MSVNKVIRLIIIVIIVTDIGSGHPIEDTTAISSSNESIESNESLESHEVILPTTVEANTTDSKANQTNGMSSAHFTPMIHPIHFYPPWSPVLFRSGPYQPFYHPYVMPAMLSPFYRTGASSVPDDLLATQPIFPVDDELSEEEAIKELEAIRKELAQMMAAREQENRLIFPSITVNPEQSSVTVSIKSFASLLRSFSSRVTVTLATRTILVPNISVKDSP